MRTLECSSSRRGFGPAWRRPGAGAPSPAARIRAATSAVASHQEQCGQCTDHGRRDHDQQPPLQAQQHDPGQEQPPPWHQSPHVQALQAALGLPAWRFQRLIQQEPQLLCYQPDTLAATLAALGAALHQSPRALVAIVEQRPGLLLQPHEGVAALAQLAHLLGRSRAEAAFLLAPHPHLLALTPAALQQRVQQLAYAMCWPVVAAEAEAGPQQPQPQPQTQPQPQPQPQQQQQQQQQHQHLREAVATAGPAGFLQLLVLPTQQTRERLAALAGALGAPPATAAALVQHHPALLAMSPAVVASRLFALAQARGSGCGELLANLDKQQLRGAASLLLLSPARLTALLQGLQALVTPLRQQPPPTAAAAAARDDAQHGSNGSGVDSSGSSSDGSSSDGSSSDGSSSDGSSSDGTTSVLAVSLLLRLGTRASLEAAQVRVAALQRMARHAVPWQQQLAAANCRQLAVLLTASHEQLAQASYLSATGQHAGTDLLGAVTATPADFAARHGPGYAAWLSGLG